MITPYATQHYKQMLKPIHCELNISAIFKRQNKMKIHRDTSSNHN